MILDLVAALTFIFLGGLLFTFGMAALAIGVYTGAYIIAVIWDLYDHVREKLVG